MPYKAERNLKDQGGHSRPEIVLILPLFVPSRPLIDDIDRSKRSEAIAIAKDLISLPYEEQLILIDQR